VTESRAPIDEEASLLADLHRSGPRQGPSGDAETELAPSLTRLRQDTPLNLADLGCGTGASTFGGLSSSTPAPLRLISLHRF